MPSPALRATTFHDQSAVARRATFEAPGSALAAPAARCTRARRKRAAVDAVVSDSGRGWGRGWHGELHTPNGARSADLIAVIAFFRDRTRGRRASHVERHGLARGFDYTRPQIAGGVDLLAEARGERHGHVHEATVPASDQHFGVAGQSGVHGVAGHVPAIHAVSR